MFTKRKLSVMALCCIFGAAAPAMAQQGPSSKIASKANKIGSSFNIQELKDGTYIRISGSAVPTFSVFKMSDPARLFVDISNSALKGQNSVKTIGNGVISHVAMLKVKSSAQAVTRVIIGFDKAAHYDVRAEGNDVVIFIDGKKRTKKAPARDLKVNASPNTVSQSQYKDAMSALGHTRTKLQKTQSQLDALNARLKTARGKDKSRLKGQIAALETQSKQARAQAALYKQQIEQARTQLTSMKREKQTLANNLQSAQTKADQASAKLANQTKQLQTTRRQVQKLEEQLIQARSKAANGDGKAKVQLVKLERERMKMGKTLKAERAERNRIQKESVNARTQLASLQKTLEQRDNQLASLKSQLAKANSSKANLPVAKAVSVDANAPNLVRDIRLEMRDGRSRIVVELDRPSKFETVPSRGARAVMILNNVKLPKKLERTLSSKVKSGTVRFVSSFVDGKKVRMEVELRNQTSETISHQGNKLVWEFAPVVASKTQPKAAPTDETPQRPVVSDTFTSAPPKVVTDPSKVNSVRGMSRKRLTIDLRDADIQNVLRLVAKEGGVNIIAGDDVKGTVTMRLRSVPLEQVFLTILQSKSLGFEMRGNVIRVAPQETLIKEETTREKARLARRALKPLEVFLLPISYATAKALVPQVQGLLSARGNVTVDERTNTLIIKDISENLEPIRVLVESLDSQVPQVLIEARIVETNDTFQQTIGIQWGGGFNASAANGNPTGLIFPGVLGLAGGADDGQTPVGGLATQQPNFAVNLPAPVGTGSGGGIGLTLGSAGGASVLNVRLSALEAAGHARIISSPKILTLDNRQATISQGTSIPISVVSAAGVQTVFVDATLELSVRPHVTPDGNVQLQIKATKNEPDFQNTGARGDPTIIRRQAETELLIKDGDTTVIGGIYTRNSGTSISAVPFFHKIPILGYFFRTSSESERRNELLIFITPKIVNRTESLGAGSAGSVTSEGKSAGKTPAKK